MSWVHVLSYHFRLLLYFHNYTKYVLFYYFIVNRCINLHKLWANQIAKVFICSCHYVPHLRAKQEMSSGGNFKVAVRVRPLIERERKAVTSVVSFWLLIACIQPTLELKLSIRSFTIMDDEFLASPQVLNHKNCDKCFYLCCKYWKLAIDVIIIQGILMNVYRVYVHSQASQTRTRGAVSQI